MAQYLIPTCSIFLNSFPKKKTAIFSTVKTKTPEITIMQICPKLLPNTEAMVALDDIFTFEFEKTASAICAINLLSLGREAIKDSFPPASKPSAGGARCPDRRTAGRWLGYLPRSRNSSRPDRAAERKRDSRTAKPGRPDTRRPR